LKAILRMTVNNENADVGKNSLTRFFIPRNVAEGLFGLKMFSKLVRLLILPVTCLLCSSAIVAYC